MEPMLILWCRLSLRLPLSFPGPSYPPIRLNGMSHDMMAHQKDCRCYSVCRHYSSTILIEMTVPCTSSSSFLYIVHDTSCYTDPRNTVPFDLRSLVNCITCRFRCNCSLPTELLNCPLFFERIEHNTRYYHQQLSRYRSSSTHQRI